MTTQLTPDVQTLRREVQEKYTELAESPDLTFHFHHGRPLAQILGYSMEQVDAMPLQAIESFAGVGNPFSLGEIQSGETVLDLGSGAGFDCFIAGPAVSSGPHHQDSGEAKIRESTAGVSRKPSSDGKARGSSSKHLCGLTA